MHSGDQLPGPERFSQADSRASFAGQGKIIQNGIHRFAEDETGNRKDRYRRSSPAKFGNGFESADIGQKNINDRQIKTGRFKCSNPDAGVGHMDSVAAFVAQRHHNRRANRWIVFHNQDPRHARLAVPSDPASTNIFFKIGPLGLWAIGSNADHWRLQTVSVVTNIAYYRANTLFKRAHLMAIKLLT